MSSASVSVLRAMLANYSLSQYRPSLLAYSVLQTVIQLCHHHHHCVTAREETASSAAAVGLEAADVKQCTISVRNFLHSTGARLLCPVFY